MKSEPKIILASGSPRRHQLLSEAGIHFESSESGVEERFRPGESGQHYAIRLAREKALAVSKRIPHSFVIGADTIVQCAGEILEKPSDFAEARRMLRALSGRDHVVITAFAIARANKVVEADAALSRVFFRPLTDPEITEYIATGEPFDKAGAYGIQGVGGGFIERVEGPRDNVMGLPVDAVLAALVKAGALDHR